MQRRWKIYILVRYIQLYLEALGFQILVGMEKALATSCCGGLNFFSELCSALSLFSVWLFGFFYLRL